MPYAIGGFEQFSLAMKNAQYVMAKLLRTGINARLAANTLVAIDDRV
jgi:hypothetical protein